MKAALRSVANLFRKHGLVITALATLGCGLACLTCWIVGNQLPAGNTMDEAFNFLLIPTCLMTVYLLIRSGQEGPKQ